MPSDQLERIKSAYDAVGYPSVIARERDVENVALRARLFGLPAAPVESCRWLDIGCSDAAQLIHAARRYPRSRFLGYDIAGRGVEIGSRLAAAAGAANVTLKQGDVRRDAPELGAFDYISIYGIFSWLPVELQTEMLAVCQRLLCRTGVCVIHYRVLPGSSVFVTLQDLARLHARDMSRDAVLDSLSELLAFLKANLPGAHPLHWELDNLDSSAWDARERSLLFHDYLSDFGSPAYFSDMASKATAAGLRYVGELSPACSWHATMTEAARRLIRRIPDRIEREQYFDFLANNSTRYSLFCTTALDVDSEIDESVFEQCCVWPIEPGALASAPSNPQLGTTVSRFFERRRAREAPVKDVVDHVLSAGQSHGGSRSRSRPDEIAVWLRLAYEDGLLGAAARPPVFSAEVSTRPVANPVARAMAAEPWFPSVINERCEPVRLDSGPRRLLAHLDGTGSAGGLATRAGLSQAQVARFLREFAENALLTA